MHEEFVFWKVYFIFTSSMKYKRKLAGNVFPFSQNFFSYRPIKFGRPIRFSRPTWLNKAVTLITFSFNYYRVLIGVWTFVTSPFLNWSGYAAKELTWALIEERRHKLSKTVGKKLHFYTWTSSISFLQSLIASDTVEIRQRCATLKREHIAGCSLFVFMRIPQTKIKQIKLNETTTIRKPEAARFWKMFVWFKILSTTGAEASACIYPSLPRTVLNQRTESWLFSSDGCANGWEHCRLSRQCLEGRCESGDDGDCPITLAGTSGDVPTRVRPPSGFNFTR